jgi:hypothetical protein
MPEARHEVTIRKPASEVFGFIADGLNGPKWRSVDSDAQTIYAAITTKAGEAAFWTSNCDVEPVVGSVARFGFPAAPVDLYMRIDALEPGETVRWTCLGDFPHWAGTASRGHSRPRRPATARP